MKAARARASSPGLHLEERSGGGVGRRRSPLHEREWQTACRGRKPTKYPYGDEHKDGYCNDSGRAPVMALHPELSMEEVYASNAAMNDPRINRSPNTVSPTGSHEHCKNGYGVFDMVGNLHEWTSETNGSRGVFRGGYYQDTHLNGDGCSYKDRRARRQLSRLLDRLSLLLRPQVAKAVAPIRQSTERPFFVEIVQPVLHARERVNTPPWQMSSSFPSAEQADLARRAARIAEQRERLVARGALLAFGTQPFTPRQ